MLGWKRIVAVWTMRVGRQTPQIGPPTMGCKKPWRSISKANIMLPDKHSPTWKSPKNQANTFPDRRQSNRNISNITWPNRTTLECCPKWLRRNLSFSQRWQDLAPWGKDLIAGRKSTTPSAESTTDQLAYRVTLNTNWDPSSVASYADHSEANNMHNRYWT